MEGTGGGSPGEQGAGEGGKRENRGCEAGEQGAGSGRTWGGKRDLFEGGKREQK